MKENIHAKKRFGQNFLTDEAILEQIAESAGLTPEDVVLEIGPGTGALTTRLSGRAKHVIAVEIDHSLRERLEQALSSTAGNVTVLFADILKTDLASLRARYTGGAPLKVVANLPYYISTPVIMKLLRDSVPPASCTVMVQKELAARMCASPGGKDYGALSVAVQYYATPEMICEVPPHAFRPQPKVTSAVVRLVPLDAPPVTVRDTDFFFRVAEGAFAHRRKTLVNSLSADPALGLSREKIADALRRLPAQDAVTREEDGSVTDTAKSPGLPADIRAERLSMEQFALLSEFLNC